MKSKETIFQFIRFGLVGCFATALHYIIYYILQRYILVNIAYTIGYAASFVANFYLTAYFTFHSSPSWKKLAGMGGAHLINYILHIVLLNIFIEIGIPDTLAPIPVFGIAIPVNFLLIHFVFNH